MRYFAELAYNGTLYKGWQKQPNDVSVQETIENALALILRESVELTGCGRTDAGVHAKQYFAHFDTEQEITPNIIRRVNKILPKDIVIYRTILTHNEAHARFDAYHRSYQYHLSRCKNPFGIETNYFFPFFDDLDLKQMQMAANILLDFDFFAPFCKSDNDAKTMRCLLSRAEWIKDKTGQSLVFHISSNRFLRGMVRLIVGMCLNVGLSKLCVADIHEAMRLQIPLKKNLSVPAQGLFLSDIRYPYL